MKPGREKERQPTQYHHHDAKKKKKKILKNTVCVCHLVPYKTLHCISLILGNYRVAYERPKSTM